LLKLDDGEAEPLVILLSENPWLTPGGSTLGSELPLVLVLVLKESEGPLLGPLSSGSLLLEALKSGLLLLGALGSGLMGLSVMVGLSDDDKPTAVDKGVTMLSVTNPSGLLAKELPGAATAGITKAAAKTTTKPPTMIKRRTVSSFSRTV
jgi:hypothetical protein